MSKQAVTEDAICSKHIIYLGDGSEESCVICEQADRITELEAEIVWREADRIAIAKIRDKKASTARKRIAELEAALKHIARHFGSAEQCRELAQAAIKEAGE